MQINSPHSVVLEHDLITAAAHEAGHFVIARHFRLSPNMRIWRSTCEELRFFRSVNGNCAFDPTTPFRRCCIGWAGVAAETLWDCPEFSHPEELAMEVEDRTDFSDLSATDAMAIQSHPQRYRALMLTSKVLIQNNREIQTMVDGVRSSIMKDFFAIRGSASQMDKGGVYESNGLDRKVIRPDFS